MNPVVESRIPEDAPAQPEVSRDSESRQASEEQKQESEKTSNYDDTFVNKILTEKKNAMERLRKYESEVKELRDNEMKAKENWKMLAEEKEREAMDWRSKFEQKEEMITKSMKVSALRKELQKLGCNPEYVDKAVKFADINRIEVDSETGVVTGHQDTAKLLSEELKPLFGNMQIGVNQTAAPVGELRELTPEDYKKLSYEERKKRLPELYKSMGIQPR